MFVATWKVTDIGLFIRTIQNFIPASITVDTLAFFILLFGGTPTAQSLKRVLLIFGFQLLFYLIAKLVIYFVIRHKLKQEVGKVYFVRGFFHFNLIHYIFWSPNGERYKVKMSQNYYGEEIVEVTTV